MVILYDAIKTIQNGVFAFVLKKEQKPVLFFEKNKKKTDCFAKKTDGLGFSQPCHLRTPFSKFAFLLFTT